MSPVLGTEININKTTVLLEGVRHNLFIDTIIKITNPNCETLVIDDVIVDTKTCLNSRRSFRNTIIAAINFFIKKEILTNEVERDLRKLINQNIYKELIDQSLNAFKLKFIVDYDKLFGIYLNRKNILLLIPNEQNLKIKVNFLFTGKYHYGVHLTIIKDDATFSLVRWRKLFNANSIIKQIIDWEEVALEHKNSDLFFTAKTDLKGYIIANKREINHLLLDLNDYTRKAES